MKLAFVINVFREDGFHSGGERVFYELVKKAVESKYTVDLYCSSYLGGQNILKSKINKICFIGHPKDFKYPEKIENFYEKVKNLIKDENYDHVISENISPPIDIGILQGHSLTHYKNSCSNIFSKLLFFLKKHKFINSQKYWLSNKYNKIIVPSNILKYELMQNFGINEEKFAVIYPGVDVPKIPTEAKHLQNSEIVFGLSAPSFANKGGNIFLKALSILKKNSYKFKAKIIYPKAKKNLYQQFLLLKYGVKDYVEFLPYQKDMQSFYKSVDAIVMPSLMETFGLVALEGMINGIPPIIGSFCGVSEILQDGKDGFVFNMEKNPEENLAAKMIYLIENKNKYLEFSKNAYKTAAKYNWHVFCDKFYEAMDD